MHRRVAGSTSMRRWRCEAPFGAGGCWRPAGCRQSRALQAAGSAADARATGRGLIVLMNERPSSETSSLDRSISLTQIPASELLAALPAQAAGARAVIRWHCVRWRALHPPNVTIGRGSLEKSEKKQNYHQTSKGQRLVGRSTNSPSAPRIHPRLPAVMAAAVAGDEGRGCVLPTHAPLSLLGGQCAGNPAPSSKGLRSRALQSSELCFCCAAHAPTASPAPSRWLTVVRRRCFEIGSCAAAA